MTHDIEREVRAKRIKVVSKAIMPVLGFVALAWDVVPFLTTQKQDTISYYMMAWSRQGWLIIPAFCGALCGHWFLPTYWGEPVLRLSITAACLLGVLVGSFMIYNEPAIVPKWSVAMIFCVYFFVGSLMWPNESL